MADVLRPGVPLLVRNSYWSQCLLNRYCVTRRGIEDTRICSQDATNAYGIVQTFINEEIEEPGQLATTVSRPSAAASSTLPKGDTLPLSRVQVSNSRQEPISRTNSLALHDQNHHGWYDLLRELIYI